MVRLCCSRVVLWVLSIVFLFVWSGCRSYNNKSFAPSVDGNISDNLSYYTEYDSPRVHSATVTIPTPNDIRCRAYDNLSGPLHPCRFEDVLNDINPYDDYEPQVHVLFQYDNYATGRPNAVLEQKGKSTRKAPQKSFRIKLDSKTNLFDRERTFQLNKHFFDFSRVKNKLFMDLFVRIPNFPSLRTRFVELTVIDDQNSTNSGSYGLFTHVEHVDVNYLKNRGWGEKDRLYKAQKFDFRYDSKYELNAKGKPKYPEQFNAAIEIKNGKTHFEFVDMLKGIKNARTDGAFKVVFEKYFNKENYMTWIAVNILSGNRDTNSQNFFLFNPRYSSTFYFLPWDYDDAANDNNLSARWELGFGLWWDIPLHRKFFSIQEYREELNRKIDEIYRNYLNQSIVSQRLELYKPIVERFVRMEPDSDELPLRYWESEWNALATDRITKNYEDYRATIGDPMPYWQSYRYENNDLVLVWEEAVDFEGDAVVYDLYLAKDPQMQELVFSRTGLDSGDYNITSWGEISFDTGLSLPPRTYFMKVVARERDSNRYQIAFDKYFDDDDTPYYGVLDITIE